MTAEELRRLIQVKEAEAFRSLRAMAHANAVPKEWMHGYILGQARYIEAFTKEQEKQLDKDE